MNQIERGPNKWDEEISRWIFLMKKIERLSPILHLTNANKSYDPVFLQLHLFKPNLCSIARSIQQESLVSSRTQLKQSSFYHVFSISSINVHRLLDQFINFGNSISSIQSDGSIHIGKSSTAINRSPGIWKSCPVGCGCRIYWLHFCREINPSSIECLE